MAYQIGRFGYDEIAQVLGDKRRIEPYYIHELRARLLGPHSGDLVGVSRYYKWITPPVIVDFEPSPLETEMCLEQKRQYCHEHGIVYVPIMLREQLTAAPPSKARDHTGGAEGTWKPNPVEDSSTVRV